MIKTKTKMTKSYLTSFAIVACSFDSLVAAVSISLALTSTLVSSWYLRSKGADCALTSANLAWNDRSTFSQVLFNWAFSAITDVS